MTIQNASPSPAPICLRCDTPMRIKTIVPTMSANAVDDIVYACPSCNIETTKTVRRT